MNVVRMRLLSALHSGSKGVSCYMLDFPDCRMYPFGMNNLLDLNSALSETRNHVGRRLG